MLALASDMLAVSNSSILVGQIDHLEKTITDAAIAGKTSILIPAKFSDDLPPLPQSVVTYLEDRGYKAEYQIKDRMAFLFIDWTHPDLKKEHKHVFDEAQESKKRH